jgi:hypothetical protein
MSLTWNTKVFTADQYGVNAVGYVGTTKTLSVKDDLLLKRTAPKPTASFSGVGRISAKLTRTLTITGALTPTGDAICEINVSIPVGFAGADVDALLNDMGAGLSSSEFKTLVKNAKIAY